RPRMRVQCRAPGAEAVEPFSMISEAARRRSKSAEVSASQARPVCMLSPSCPSFAAAAVVGGCFNVQYSPALARIENPAHPWSDRGYRAAIDRRCTFQLCVSVMLLALLRSNDVSARTRPALVAGGWLPYRSGD